MISTDSLMGDFCTYLGWFVDSTRVYWNHHLVTIVTKRGTIPEPSRCGPFADPNKEQKEQRGMTCGHSVSTWQSLGFSCFQLLPLGFCERRVWRRAVTDVRKGPPA
jgi:hypothetical protein